MPAKISEGVSKGVSYGLPRQLVPVPNTKCKQASTSRPQRHSRSTVVVMASEFSGHTRDGHICKVVQLPMSLTLHKSLDLSEDDGSVPLAVSPPEQLAFIAEQIKTLGSQPDCVQLHKLCSEVHLQLPHLRCGELSSVIHALAVIGHKPSEEWFKDFELKVYTNMTDFSGLEAVNIIWAFAQLDHQPILVVDSLLAHLADRLGELAPDQLALTLWSLGKLQHVPPIDWIRNYLGCVQANLFQLTPNQMSHTAWSLARLGLNPPDTWLDQFLLVAQWRFPSFDAHSLSTLLWALGHMGMRPTQEWLFCFEEQVRDKFSQFKARDLVCMIWALEKLGFSKEHNMVLYFLHQQNVYLPVDYELLQSPSLLRMVSRLHHDVDEPGSARSGQ